MFIGEELHPSHHLNAPRLDLLQQVRVLIMLRVPELNVVLHVGSPESRVGGENYLPGPAGHAAFEPALDVVGFFSFLTALGGWILDRFSL